MKTFNKNLIFSTLLTLLVFACNKDDVPSSNNNNSNNNNGTPTNTKSSAKDITKFSFAALSPAVDATIDGTAKTISATVPANTDLTKLVPTITISDKATVSPATGIAQNFFSEKNYTITAEDGSTAIWKVNVKLDSKEVSLCRLVSTSNPVGKSTYEYDKQSRIIKIIDFDSKGTPVTTRTYSYSSEGNMLTFTYINSSRTISSLMTYKNGLLVEEKTTVKTNTSNTMNTTTYEYDTNERLIKKNQVGTTYTFNNEGRTTSIISPIYEYELNEDGLIAKEIFKTSGTYSLYKYDTDGQVILKEDYDKTNKKLSYTNTEYSKDKENGTAIIRPSYIGIPNYQNPYGNNIYRTSKVSRFTINAKGEDVASYSFTFKYNLDAKGNILTMILTDNYGSTTTSYTYENCN